MPIHTTFLDFLRTGSLGPVVAGLPEESLIALIGAPQYKLAVPGTRYAYGDLEIQLEDGLVIALSLYFWRRAVPRLPRRLKLTIPRVRRCEPVINYLKQHGVGYCSNKLLTFDDQKTIELPRSGVQITFHPDRIYGMHSFAGVRRGQRRKDTSSHRSPRAGRP